MDQRWQRSYYKPELQARVSAVNDEEARPRRYYRPWIHHPAALMALALTAFALIGLIEFGARVLPAQAPLPPSGTPTRLPAGVGRRAPTPVAVAATALAPRAVESAPESAAGLRAPPLTPSAQPSGAHLDPGRSEVEAKSTPPADANLDPGRGEVHVTRPPDSNLHPGHGEVQPTLLPDSNLDPKHGEVTPTQPPDPKPDPNRGGGATQTRPPDSNLDPEHGEVTPTQPPQVTQGAGLDPAHGEVDRSRGPVASYRFPGEHLDTEVREVTPPDTQVALGRTSGFLDPKPTAVKAGAPGGNEHLNPGVSVVEVVPQVTGQTNPAAQMGPDGRPVDKHIEVVDGQTVVNPLPPSISYVVSDGKTIGAVTLAPNPAVTAVPGKQPQVSYVVSNGVTVGTVTPSPVQYLVSNGVTIATMTPSPIRYLVSNGVTVGTVGPSSLSYVVSNGVTIGTVAVAPKSYLVSNGVTISTLAPATATATNTEDPTSASHLSAGAMVTVAPGSKDEENSPLKGYIPSDKPLTWVDEWQNYFFQGYLPVLIAVLFRMLIGYLYTTVKMMEPFAMLSKPGGVPAQDFLWINYLASNDTLAPFYAMISGHTLMLWISILYVAAQILSPLSAELLSIQHSSFATERNSYLIGPAVRINLLIARILQGILAFIGVMLINAWYLLRHNESHIYNDPSSIAGVACLIHHPDTMRDFASLDQTLSKKDIEERLTGRRYHLGLYHTANGSPRYGIISSENGYDKIGYAMPYPPAGHTPHGSVDLYARPSGPVPPSPASPPPRHRRAAPWKQFALNTLFVLVMLGLLALLAWYYRNSDLENHVERFLDNQSFGPRALLVCVALYIKSQWTRLERRASVQAPFVALRAPGGAPAQRAVLAPRPLVPLSTLVYALPRGGLRAALLAAAALAAECLVILLPSIPFNPMQLWVALQWTFFVSFGVLAAMLLAWLAAVAAPAALAACRPARARPRLPHTPNTVGAVALYVAGARLADDLGWCAGAGPSASDEWAAVRGRRCALLKTPGPNGQKRWTIDYVGQRTAA